MDDRPMRSSEDLVVFSPVRDSKCAECGEELLKGQFLFMEGKYGEPERRPLCLKCADLDHLVYLGSGDAALTRRARKNSKLSAIVVRWSRARKRCERQGVLVEEAALEQAEEKCLADADVRAARRQRAELRRVDEDRDLAARMAATIRSLFPRCPAKEADAIAAHTAARGSGRVGRTAAGQKLEEEAVTAAVIAAIRHKHTEYDELLMEGYDRRDARRAVRNKVDEVVQLWRNAAQ